MTDQEILEKYREKIEQNMTQLYEQLNLKDDFEKQAYLEEYQKRFIHGFRDGLKNGMAKKLLRIAKAMLQKNMDIHTISDITGLPRRQIEEIADAQR
jgi:flagellar biosynthesis/type III secretory pathway protein FliH